VVPFSQAKGPANAQTRRDTEHGRRIRGDAGATRSTLRPEAQAFPTSQEGFDPPDNYLFAAKEEIRYAKASRQFDAQKKEVRSFRKGKRRC